MPKISFRIGGAGAAGAAAGMAHARQIARENQALRFDQDEHEFLTAQREKEATEERSAHSWLDEEYGRLTDDPVRVQAYSGLPLEMKGAVLRQERQLKAVESGIRSMQSDLQYLAANPRYAPIAEEVQTMLSQDPLSVDIGAVREKVREAKSKAAADQATMLRATKTMGQAQMWLQSIVDPQSPTSGEIDEYDLGAMNIAVTNLANAMERGQDPNLPPLTAEELKDLQHKITMAKVPPKDLEIYDEEVQARMLQNMDRLFMESLGPDSEQPPAIWERISGAAQGGRMGAQQAPAGGAEFGRLAAQAEAQTAPPPAKAEGQRGSQDVEESLRARAMGGNGQAQPAPPPAAQRPTEGAAQEVGKPETGRRLAVPWMKPAKGKGALRPIAQAQRSGQVFWRLMRDLADIYTKEGPEAFDKAATEAGIYIDADLRRELEMELARQKQATNQTGPGFFEFYQQ